ncbi:MAG TPA: hypothetical protein PKG50_02290 [Candidatus Bipolaricaulis anaerobius]|nr:hypothetical protein [Candidatus Bipolaricaulis anaerobius]HNS23670.1 hypothetical protein [Candidatus Bipolaricaulis anaerobius]
MEMMTWMKVVAVALVAVVGLLPTFAQLSYAQAAPVQEASVTLPYGEELPDAELLQVDGEADPLTIIATMAVCGSVSAATDLTIQGVKIAAGSETEINWKDVGIAAVGGATLGAVAEFVTQPAVKIVRSAMVEGARWTARAAKATGVAVTSLAYKAHETLHTVHVALHNYVRTPVGNAFRSAWDWLTGK